MINLIVFLCLHRHLRCQPTIRSRIIDHTINSVTIFAIKLYSISFLRPGQMNRILLFTNVVFDCLSTELTYCGPDCHGNTIHDQLSNYTQYKQQFDYIYFNDDEFRDQFTADDLYRSLSAVFPQSNSSQNHLYFANSLDDIDDQLDDSTISYCVDRMRSRSLIETKKCDISFDENPPLDESVFILYYLIGSMVIIGVIMCSIAFFICIRRHYRAVDKRNEFIRQIAINDRHQFDYIQTLWKVGEQNIEIDYANQIGKGTQSIVYCGESILHNISLCFFITFVQ